MTGQQGAMPSTSTLARKVLQETGNAEAKALFAQAIGEQWVPQFDPEVRSALMICMTEIYRFDMLRFYQPWVSLLFGDPDLESLRTAADKLDQSEETLFGWLSEAKEEELAFLSDDLFLEGLRLLLIPNVPMEELLAALRKWLCLNAAKLSANDRLSGFEPFLVSLAEQCFFNEYAYPASEAELEAVAELAKATPEQSGSRSLFAIAGCYSSLFEAFPDRFATLSELSAGSPRFARLFKTQVLDPLEERELAASTESFGAFANRVSAEVRAQYEENPYPRWISAGPLPPDARDQQHSGPYRILVAGCGTGKQVLGTLANFPDASVVAIDISRASLGYAARKVREAGFGVQVRFVHADILAMEDWPEQFDLIECTGVLHHMEDPLLGWRILTERLKPGGHFRVALYSETARAGFVAAQRLARDQGIAPNPDGIRAFRKAILDRPEADPLRQSLLSAGDFFTTSALRDLVFHVQEHRFSLVEIEAMLEQLGLTCTNFLVPKPAVALEFDRMFPQDRNRASLANWHKFEQRYPATFAGMYEFWCRKDG